MDPAYGAPNEILDLTLPSSQELESSFTSTFAFDPAYDFSVTLFVDFQMLQIEGGELALVLGVGPDADNGFGADITIIPDMSDLPTPAEDSGIEAGPISGNIIPGGGEKVGSVYNFQQLSQAYYATTETLTLNYVAATDTLTTSFPGGTVTIPGSIAANDFTSRRGDNNVANALCV